MMAERVIVQLNHANSAVVLTAIKVLLYLMNYMENRKLMEYICKKMGPPLGTSSQILTRAPHTHYTTQLRYCPLGRRYNMSPFETYFSSSNEDHQY